MFPVCFLAVISVIYILLFMYSEVAAGAMTHVAANAAMGKDAGTVITYEHVPDQVDVYKTTRGARECYKAGKSVRSKRGGLLTKTVGRTVGSTTYLVDEAKLIRYTDFFRE